MEAGQKYEFIYKYVYDFHKNYIFLSLSSPNLDKVKFINIIRNELDTTLSSTFKIQHHIFLFMMLLDEKYLVEPFDSIRIS
jgi:hypothetical protein